MRLWSKLKTLFRRRQAEAEMSEEIRLHLELQTERNLAAGMEPDEARYAAQRMFGGVEQVKERCREQRRWRWIERIAQDVRFAWRGLRNRPGFAFVVIGILATGIGANCTVFSVLHALLLRPLPGAVHPDRLFALEARGALDPRKEFPYGLFDRTGHNLPMPYPFFEHLRHHAADSVDLAAVSGWTMLRPLALRARAGGEVESVNVEEVSGNYFTVVGVTAMLGRTLMPEDDQPGAAAPVAVMSHDFWRDRMGADPAVLGRTVTLDGVPLTIVGVASPRFVGARVGNGAALWVPIGLSPQIDSNVPWGVSAIKSATSPWINVLARLEPGASREGAEAELDLAYQQKLAELDPRRTQATRASDPANLLEQHLALLPAGTGYGGARSAYRRPAVMLMAIVGFMQLLACANVMGLLLARGAGRQKELALRATLGASRGRLVQQLLIEALVLAGVAGVIGWGLAQLGTRVIGSAVAGVGLWADARVLGFTLLVTVASGLVLGTLPAWRLSGRELMGAIKGAAGPTRQRFNGVLVVAQISLALLLLVVAGLFGRTFYNLVHTETGFQPSGRVLFDLNVPSSHAPAERFALYQRVADATEALPGVESAAVYQGFSLLGDTAFALGFTAEGYAPAVDEQLQARIGRVGPGFFRTMGIPLLQGRDFPPREDPTATPAAPLLLSAWSARRLFGPADPVGRRIQLGGEAFVVTGVVSETKYGGLRDEPGFVFYMRVYHWPNAFRVTFVVRTAEQRTISLGELNAAVGAIDPAAQISGLRTIQAQLDRNLAQDRLVAQLAGFFGLLSVAFAGIGLFGLMSYTVASRTNELGVRLALGATPGGILARIVRQGIRLGALGCGVGLLGAWGLTRFVSSMLYETRSTDPVTFGVSVGGLMLIVLAASVLPARRAAKVDPIVALRCE